MQICLLLLWLQGCLSYKLLIILVQSQAETFASVIYRHTLHELHNPYSGTICFNNCKKFVFIFYNLFPPTNEYE